MSRVSNGDRTSSILRLPRSLKKRSSSAPPAPGRRYVLIEEHYRVDPVKRLVLPGVPKHEKDSMKEAHDLFNLVVLIPVIVLNLMNWNWDLLISVKSSHTSAWEAWTGDWFNSLYFYAQSYFVVDLLWIILVPQCVRSPTTIIQHHIATILYMLIPWFYPEYRFVMGALLFVEINTWFLIARRVFNKQGFPPWIIDLPPFVSIRIKLISVFFYLTWIVIRCIIYPYVLLELVGVYDERSRRLNTRFNVCLISLSLQACFVILNFKWTYDLVMSKMRYWRRKDKKAKEQLSKGL